MPSRPTSFTRGVIATNFRRLSWADRLRFAARVIGRRSLERLGVPAIGFEGADLEQLDGDRAGGRDQMISSAKSALFFVLGHPGIYSRSQPMRVTHDEGYVAG